MRIIKKSDRANNAPAQYVPVRSLIDEFFNTPFGFGRFANNSLMNTPSVSADVWEEGENLMIKMALPGIKKDDVKIEINGDMITIKGASSEKSEEKSDKKYYYQSMESSFEQSFNLPTFVDADKADAKYEDGVLTVTLPKAEQFKPREIKVG